MRILSGSTCLVPSAEMADTLRIRTAFMRFPIDVLFLDARRHVVAMARAGVVGPSGTRVLISG